MCHVIAVSVQSHRCNVSAVSSLQCTHIALQAQCTCRLGAVKLPQHRCNVVQHKHGTVNALQMHCRHETYAERV